MNSKKYLTNKYSAMLIALFCSVLWGSAFPVLKISYVELGIKTADISSKIVLAGMRFLLAALMLFLLAKLVLRIPWRIERKTAQELFLLGVLQTSLQYFFFYNGLAHTSGMSGALLSSSGTFFVVLLAHFYYGNDKLTWSKALGLLTGFLGIAVINWGQVGQGVAFTWQGEGFLLLAGLAGAFGTILSKRLTAGTHPFLITAWQMLLGSILLLGVGFIDWQPQGMVFTPKGWLLLFYAAFLSAAAFSLWNSLLKYNKAGEISMYKFMVPVSGTILSAFFIPGESLSIYVLLALMLVAVGMFIVNYQK